MMRLTRALIALAVVVWIATHVRLAIDGEYPIMVYSLLGFILGTYVPTHLLPLCRADRP